MRRAPLCAALCILAASAAAFEWQYAVDGDSLQGKDDEQARLLCIDAPELYQRGGRQSQAVLQEMLGAGVRLETRGKDRHQRHLVLLTDRSGASINIEMIRRGQAWVMRRYARSCGLPPHLLYAAEREARQQKRGIWKDANPQPPWEWRRENPRR